MFKVWDKVNSFLDNHFETVERPTPTPKEPPVRKFYKITVYTGHPNEEEHEYYSTAIHKAVKQYANNMLVEFAEHMAMEHYWVDAEDWEEEEDFYERFFAHCGVEIIEVPKQEYFAQVKAIWRME